jgi:hypothetical protein
MSFRSAAELAQHPELMEPPRILARPLAVLGFVILLVMTPKGGKSTTAAAQIAEASRRGIRCALITIDEALPVALRRLAGFGADLANVYLDDRWEPATLAEQIRSLEIEILVLDHLGTLAELNPDFGAGSQGDPVLWGRLVQPFMELARELNVAVILIDQGRRSDGKWGGSVGKGGKVDVLVELESKDGGLEATPRGRVPLPRFRVELDANGIPRFSEAAVAVAGAALGPTNEKRRALLQVLADSAPEGLTSSGWMKVSGFPKETYNRNRRALVRDGLALSPAETRSRYYRITEKGELSLKVPEVPLGTTGTTVPLGSDGTRGTSPYVIGLVHGTSQALKEETAALEAVVP